MSGTATADNAASAVALRTLDSFEGTGFAELSESIFGDAARRQRMNSLLDAGQLQGHDRLWATLPKPERIRIGAFDGATLVGFTNGWFEVGGRFHIGLSGVHPAHRRRGLYTRLMAAVEQAVRERGGLTISSQHVTSNTPVLIAKLRLGYVITGTEYLEQMGLLVRLVKHLAPGHRALFDERTGVLGGPTAP